MSGKNMQDPRLYRCANCKRRVGDSPPEYCEVCRVSTFELYAPFHFDTTFRLRRLFMVVLLVGAYIAVFRPGPNTPIEGNPLGWPFHLFGTQSVADWFIGGPIILGLSVSVMVFVLFPQRLTGIIAAIGVLVWIGFGYLLAMG